jgi:hypothetical protein
MVILSSELSHRCKDKKLYAVIMNMYKVVYVRACTLMNYIFVASKVDSD